MQKPLHPLVRELMVRICYLKREHNDPQYFMASVRREFLKNADLTNESDIKRAVMKGRWMVREEQERNRFKQYRELQKRYNPTFRQD